MLKLVMTCGACPEQYDVFDEAGREVGYLRLRHGYFAARCPNSDGEEVYHASPLGDGVFDSEEEREYHLRFAVDAILRWIAGERTSKIAPNVQFIVEGKPLD